MLRSNVLIVNGPFLKRFSILAKSPTINAIMYDEPAVKHDLKKEKAILNDILRYIPDCRFEYWPGLGLGERLKINLKSYCMLFLCLLISGILAKTLDELVPPLFHLGHLLHNDVLRFLKLVNGSALKTFITICIMAPVLEETICRLPLSFKPIHIALSIAIIVLFLTGFGYGNITQDPLNLTLRLPMAIITFFVVKAVLNNPKYYPVDRLSPRAKRGFILFSIVLFGLAHIANFKPLHYQVWFLYPLLVIPQMCMGWVFTYVRLRNGVFYSILLHGFTNSLPFLLTISTHQ